MACSTAGTAETIVDTIIQTILRTATMVDVAIPRHVLPLITVTQPDPAMTVITAEILVAAITAMAEPPLAARPREWIIAAPPAALPCTTPHRQTTVLYAAVARSAEAAAVAAAVRSAEAVAAVAVVRSVEEAAAVAVVHSAEAAATVAVAHSAEAAVVAVEAVTAVAEAARSAVVVKTRTSAFIIRCTSRIGHCA